MLVFIPTLRGPAKNQAHRRQGPKLQRVGGKSAIRGGLCVEQLWHPLPCCRSDEIRHDRSLIVDLLPRCLLPSVGRCSQVWLRTAPSMCWRWNVVCSLSLNSLLSIVSVSRNGLRLALWLGRTDVAHLRSFHVHICVFAWLLLAFLRILVWHHPLATEPCTPSEL